MTPRKRVLAILNGQKPDRVPWFAALDYWGSVLILRGEKPRDFMLGKHLVEQQIDIGALVDADVHARGVRAFDRPYIEWHRDLGAGFYYPGTMTFKTIIENCEVKELREGNLRRRRIGTPYGTLQETWTWLPESFCQAPTEHLVKSTADLSAYRYIHENTRYEPDYALVEERRIQVGEMGVLVADIPTSPLMQMIVSDAGVTGVFEMYAEAPEEFAETIEAVRRSHDAAARIAVDSPAEILVIPENLSSDLVGKTFYEMFVRDYHQTWAARSREVGKFSCIHMDGSMKGLLRETCSTGLTFIEALTPAPVGDLEIENWAEWSGNSHTVLWGGIPGSYFTGLVSDEEFDRHVKRVLGVMRSTPRYVLGVADEVPPDGLERRVRRVGELVERYGVYE